MPSDLRKDRKLVNGRWIRWSAERAANAYVRGLWVHDTLADSLRTAAREAPHRVLLIDGDTIPGAATFGRAAGSHACAKLEALRLRRRIRATFLDPPRSR